MTLDPSTGFILAVVLLALTFLRALGLPMPRHRSARMIAGLAVVALVAMFLVTSGVRFADLAVPELAPSAGPNPSRMPPPP